MTRQRLTLADEAYIRDHWPLATAQQIAAVIGKTPTSIHQRASVLQLRKDPALLSEIRSTSGGRRVARSTP